MVDSDLIFPKEITIYSEASQFIFQKSSNPNDYISFNKESMKVKKLPLYTPKLGQGNSVYSILGIINGVSNFYLIGVSKALFVGSILSSRVFKIEELVFLSSMGNENNNVIEEQDQRYILMVKDFLKRNNLYFSDVIDLSVNLQNKFTGTNKPRNPGQRDSYIFTPQTVPHFCWNYNLSLELDAIEMIGFVHSVINGFVEIRSVGDYPQSFDYSIIARKDARRSGMRFLVRGNDKNGNAANFVESEMIIEEKNYNEGGKVNVVSYVQVRGSIPFLWTQPPNLLLNPKITPRDDYTENSTIFRKHVSSLRDAYGRIVLVNLIDKKKDQKNIGEYYQNLSKDLKDSKTNPIKEIDYVWFDFHNECKGMKYENLSKLIKYATVSQALNQLDFFHVQISNGTSEFSVLSTQKGVFRTNCIDCLDRTNVVQTMFSRIILQKIFQKLKIIDEAGEDLQVFNPIFEISFKNLWADHGDYLSKAYSGTNALKSDYVRTGKRNMVGAIKDGIYTCNRFYINNFCDGYNQDCHDYFLRKINPKNNKFKEHSTNAVKFLTPSVFLLVFTLYYFLINIALPEDYEDGNKKILLRFMIFAGIFYLTFKTVFNTLKTLIIDTATTDYF